MSTTTSDKNTATVLNNGPVYYTEITGSAFEHVINDDGSEYKYGPLAYRPDGLRQDECGDAGSKSFELARFGPDPQQ